MRYLAYLLSLLLFLSVPLALADDPPEDDETEPTEEVEEGDEEEEMVEEPEEEPEEGIAWVRDYEEAEEKAKAEDKGLFVYLTPSWFT